MNDQRRIGIHVALPGILVTIAALFGGGGSPAPFAELVVQLAAIGAGVALVIRLRPIDRLLIAGVLLVVAMPLVQLVPLPPAIWHALPGRQSEQAALAMIGASDRWMPLSVSPPLTLAALLSLLPPIVVAFGVAQAQVEERRQLIRVVAGVSLLGALVGALQILLGGNNALRFYPITHYGFATGFFANRNAAADQFVIGALACAYLAAPRPGSIAAHAAAVAFLALVTVLTGSRAGIVLLLVPVIYALAFAGRASVRTRVRWGGAAAAALALTAAGALLGGNAVIDRSLDRFLVQDGLRESLRADTRFAIRESWPVGTGLGTFVPVFIAGESLESVGDTRPNRAHQDYLEFTLETGLAGLALLTAAMAALIWRGWQGWRARRDPAGAERWRQMRWAAAALAVLALHSLVDYPLRSMTLATVAAVAVAMFARLPDKNIPAMKARVDAT